MEGSSSFRSRMAQSFRRSLLLALVLGGVAPATMALADAAAALPAAQGQIWHRIAGQTPPGLSADDWASIQAIVAAGPYLKASNTGTDDQFGLSVAVDGDTVVVGAPAEASNATGVNGNQANNSAFDAGAAYVFVRSGGVWNQQAYLKASNAEAGDRFGASVGISGDTIVVGAYREDSSATGVDGSQANNASEDSGAAYVFVRSGTTWSQQAYLKASNTGTIDWFGGTVAIDGDTVVVGAMFEDCNSINVNGFQGNNFAENAGAAYVFVRSGVAWSQQAYLKASNTNAEDWFGGSLALDGDTIVVGAQREDSDSRNSPGDNSFPDAGAAYVFVRSGTTWSLPVYLKASNIEPGDNFGDSVAVSGSTVIVGATSEDSSATGVNGNQSSNAAPSSGAAYVFVRSGATWPQQAYLKASNTGADDLFGSSIAADGETVVISARWEASSATGINGDQSSNAAPDSGAAYVFVRSGTTWSQQAYLKASNTGAGDSFGLGVAVDGETVVVGAWLEDSAATGVDGDGSSNAAPESGAAYIFDDGAAAMRMIYAPIVSGKPAQ